MTVAPIHTLKNLDDLAAVLSIPRHILNWYVRPERTASHYSTFEIKQRNGKTRSIHAPKRQLKSIQRQLADSMAPLYLHRQYVHGFRRDKSIKTNALTHIRARSILSIDLVKFFDQITFGRVQGLLRGNPFNLPKAVAQAIASICTRNGVLAQGAPTSPIVSNFICRGLDRRLFEIAKKYRVSYTRYADDITFSTRSNGLPGGICSAVRDVSIESIREINDAIVAEGFSINKEKLRIMSRFDRQSVTGITVNQFANVRRTYIKRIRGIIKGISKYGLEPAAEKILSADWRQNRQHTALYRAAQSDAELLMPRLCGMIEFVRFVKGEDDPVYKSIACSFNDLGLAKQIFVPPSTVERLQRSVWVVEFGDSTGTGFFVSPRTFVTCTHCIDNIDKNFDPGESPVIYNPLTKPKKIELSSTTFVSQRDELDIAVFQFSKDMIPSEFAMGVDLRSGEFRFGEVVRHAGYPNHGIGKQIEITDSKVTSNYARHGNRLAKVEHQIIAGRSGGCVLDQRNKVVGIVRFGAQPGEGATDENAFQYLASSVVLDPALEAALTS